MTAASAQLIPRATKPLLIPLVLVASLAIIEAVALVILIVIFARPVATPHALSSPPTANAGNTAPQATPSPPAVNAASTTRPAGLVRGKRGERVDSNGFAITVENILYKPASDPIGLVGGERRYVALLLLVENNTGGNISFYPTSFRLQDSQKFEYEPLAMKLTAPALDWRHLGSRESIRGFVDFTLPKSASGLTLVYPQLARPIHVDLGE